LIDAEWHAAADARYRSAVSRAYYAAFLFLREKIIPTRAWPPGGFPKVGVHNKVLRAVEGAFPPNHQIPTKLRTLLEERGLADYDLAATFDRLSAEDRCEESDVFINRVRSLSPAKLTDIANRI
jgi:uncharacterized protein (UPF0332 family)